MVKNLPASAGDMGDMGLIPESERFLGVQSGNLLQYSCLEDSTDRGTWWATVHGATESQTQLSDWTTHPHTYISKTVSNAKTHSEKYKEDLFECNFTVLGSILSMQFHK